MLKLYTRSWTVCASRWMDGSSLGFQRWDENQPDANTFDENCVAMTYYMGESFESFTTHGLTIHTTLLQMDNDGRWLVQCVFAGFWRGYNCGQEYLSICKRRTSAAANTTVAPTLPPKGGCPLTWTQFDSKVRPQCLSSGLKVRSLWPGFNIHLITINECSSLIIWYKCRSMMMMMMIVIVVLQCQQ